MMRGGQLSGEQEFRHRRAIVAADPVERLARMVEIRACEDRIGELFATGEIRGTTHLGQGQEAVAVGIAAATNATDHVTCTYRGHALALALGLTCREVIGEVMGKATGCIEGLGGSMHMSEPSIGLLPSFAIVGAGIPVAVGAALAGQLRGDGTVAVAVFGDGTTNIGAFHEALNLASVWDLPVVFVCENNLYGEYSPIATTTPIGDLATRAESYAMPGEIVDGQSVVDVIEAIDRAVARARHGDGPTLVEAKTYRYSGHSRSDTGPYRPDGELEQWRRRDPIELERARLEAAGLLDAAGWERIVETAVGAVTAAVDEARRAGEVDVRRLFELSAGVMAMYAAFGETG